MTLTLNLSEAVKVAGRGAGDVIAPASVGRHINLFYLAGRPKFLYCSDGIFLCYRLTSMVAGRGARCRGVPAFGAFMTGRS
jgi:hypothetical protein